jgi:arsenite-transporting ATPase
LLEKGWEEVKTLEAQYLRTPTLKNVYGQELGILPGMDSALTLNALREYDKGGNYDVIVYDGPGDLHTVRMFGIPDILSWYVRRFRQVFTDSDIGKSLAPFVQPVTSAIFNTGWTTSENLSGESEPTILEEGKIAIADPNRVAAYLVTTEDKVAIATGKYLWGCSQQVGLTVGGVLLNQSQSTANLTSEFSPLPVTALPKASAGDWQTLENALPDFKQVANAPKPLTIDTANRQVRVFLPGFDKSQVKLTQYGTEITIEAGEQRRNIFLPPPLNGQSVKGAKFQDGYLIISL